MRIGLLRSVIFGLVLALVGASAVGCVVESRRGRGRTVYVERGRGHHDNGRHRGHARGHADRGQHRGHGQGHGNGRGRGHGHHH